MSAVMGPIGGMMEAAELARQLGGSLDHNSACLIEIFIERDGFMIRGRKLAEGQTFHAITWQQFAQQPKVLIAGVRHVATKLGIG